MKLSVTNWEQYMKIVRQLEGAIVPKDPGLLLIMKQSVEQGADDPLQFMASGVLICKGQLQEGWVELLFQKHEFRFIIDILLNVQPRTDTGF